MISIVWAQAASLSERIQSIASLIVKPIASFWEIGAKNPWYLLGVYFYPLLIFGLYLVKSRSGTNTAPAAYRVKTIAVIYISNIIFCIFIAPIFSSQALRYVYPHVLTFFILFIALDGLPSVISFTLGVLTFFFLFSFNSLQNHAYDLSNNTGERARRIAKFESFVSPLLKHGAYSNAWCNTILKADFDTSTELLGIPEGFGLSYILYQPDFKVSVKSRFVLVVDDEQTKFLKQ